MSNQNEKIDMENQNEIVAIEEKQTVISVPIKKPIQIDGESINSLKLDFSNMTGADILKVDEELRLEGLSFNNVYDPRVLLSLTSRAAKMLPEDLKKLHAADFTEVIFTTRNFFLRW